MFRDTSIRCRIEGNSKRFLCSKAVNMNILSFQITQKISLFYTSFRSTTTVVAHFTPPHPKTPYTHSEFMIFINKFP